MTRCSSLPFFNDSFRRVINLSKRNNQQSTINNAGRGLFVRDDVDIHIPAGQIVSFYPIHAVGANYWKGQCIGATSIDDQPYFDSIDHSNYLLNLIGDRVFPGGHHLEAEFRVQPYIDTNPNRPEYKGWMAHLMNDCAIVECPTESAILQYYEHVQTHQNCIIIPFGPAPICVAVTTQNVTRGQELFMGYGYWYWMDYSSSSSSSSLPQRHPPEEEMDKSDRILTIERLLFDEMLHTMKSVEQQYADEIRDLTRFFNDLVF